MRKLIIATVALAFVSSTALAQSTDKGAAPAAGDTLSKGDMSKDPMAHPINMERRRDEMETSTMAADLASRAQDIHWAAGFEPEHADLFAHNETLINTSCETVWQHIVNAKAWPQMVSQRARRKPHGRCRHADARRPLALDNVRPRDREPRA